MGRIKFLRLQMIPWCFQYCIMGNGISSSGLKLQRPDPPPVRNIKLIKPDGEVKIYEQPIQASELMLEHPKHMVCRTDSFYIGQKIPPLSEQEQLQLGHNYFLLPVHFFQSVLSFVTIASFASSSSQPGRHPQSQPPAVADSSTNSLISSSRARDDDLKRAAFLRKAAASSCPPFDLQKTPSGSLRIRVSEEFISQLMMKQGKQLIKDEEGEEEIGSICRLLCTTPQLQKDYRQLVINGSHRQWKPKLEVIKETPHHSKRKVLSSFGMKRRYTTAANKKKSHQSSSSSGTHLNQKKKTQKRAAAADQLQTHHLPISHHRHHVSSSSSSSKPPSKHKIRGFTTCKSR